MPNYQFQTFLLIAVWRQGHPRSKMICRPRSRACSTFLFGSLKPIRYVSRGDDQNAHRTPENVRCKPTLIQAESTLFASINIVSKPSIIGKDEPMIPCRSPYKLAVLATALSICFSRLDHCFLKARFSLTEQASQIRRIYFNPAWSHDSKSIAFKAQNQNGQDMLVVADVDSVDGFKVVHVGETSMKVTWHPDNKRICFSARDADSKLTQMYVVDRTTNKNPSLLVGQPRSWNNLACDWSPDGKRIVFRAQPQLEWPPLEEVNR